MVASLRTLTVLGVVTTCSTVEYVEFEELTVRTTVFRNRSGTSIRTAGTLVTVAIGTSVSTLLGVDPAIGLTGEDVVANTLHRVLSTGGDTLTVLTNARHVRGVTTVVTARPGVLCIIVFTVTAIAVPPTPACAVALVGSELTVVTLTGFRVTVVSTTQSAWVNVRSVTVEAVRASTQASVLCIHTCSLAVGLAITLTIAGVVTTIGTGDGVPLVELTVRTTVVSLTV